MTRLSVRAGAPLAAALLLSVLSTPARAHVHGGGPGASHHFTSQASVHTGFAHFARPDALGNRLALTTSLQLAASPRLALGLDLPFHLVRLAGGQRLGGPGDPALSVAGVLVQGRRGQALVGRLSGSAPLGAAHEGLGMGHVMAAAQLEGALPLAPRWTASARAGAHAMLGAAHAQHDTPAYVYPHARREAWLHATGAWQALERVGLWAGLESLAVPAEGWRTLGGAALGGSLAVRPGASLMLEARAPLWGERRFGPQLGLSWSQAL